jgi:hypothetical protein
MRVVRGRRPLPWNSAARVTWSGTHRAPLVDQAVPPRPVQDPLPAWVAVGGSPAQVHEIFGHHRFLVQSSLGAAPHRRCCAPSKLVGTEVAPIVRAEVAKRTVASG